jgi:hypothetical protein
MAPGELQANQKDRAHALPGKHCLPDMDGYVANSYGSGRKQTGDL